MNNKEQIEKQIAELEQSHAEQIQKLRDELNRSESNQWKPENREGFFYISAKGEINHDNYLDEYNWHIKLIKNGNCFRTEEEAKNSLKYHVMNSEYDYWHAGFGIPKPKFEPKGLKYWDYSLKKWNRTSTKVKNWHSNDTYCWKREEQ